MIVGMRLGRGGGVWGTGGGSRRLLGGLGGGAEPSLSLRFDYQRGLGLRGLIRRR